MAQIHRSVATLRVFGDTLLPGEISRLLGAEPDDARTKGDQLTGCKTGIVRIAKDGMWRIDATSREPGNLEEQVQEVLSRLTNDLSVWSDLSVRFEIDLFCGLFMEEGIRRTRPLG